MDGDTRRVTRRAVLGTTAWSVPVIAVGAVVPVAAASACGGVAAPSTAAGWTVTKTNMSTNGGTDQFTNNGYVLVQDPASTAAASEVVQSPSQTFLAGRTYTFTFNYTTYSKNPRKLTMSFQINGVAQSTGAIDTSTTNGGSGTKTVTYSPTTTVTSPVVLRYDFVAATGTTGDDITISNFANTCT
ncbi:hypothetical protein [Allobranchiibius sp. GilTou73]|uniref:hypothetical protein n=1 Tax=Allobranchiibius sp. GilTou73 TaxID=2904523 RepID=UPI001F285DD2|nr:hypothetical protein [Allobranchiibius sp. GilTou73]UIJ33726.1 hypothetical protein LVQ62_11220 [Allobranchiibius sp. GilTou73]